MKKSKNYSKILSCPKIVHQIIKILLDYCLYTLLGLLIFNLLILSALPVGLIALSMNHENISSTINQKQILLAQPYQAVELLIVGQLVPNTSFIQVLIVLVVLAGVGFLAQVLFKRIWKNQSRLKLRQSVIFISLVYLSIFTLAIVSVVWLVPVLLAPKLILFILSWTILFFALLYIFISISKRCG